MRLNIESEAPSDDDDDDGGENQFCGSVLSRLIRLVFRHRRVSSLRAVWRRPQHKKTRPRILLQIGLVWGFWGAVDQVEWVGGLGRMLG